jgi:hypothetical protein
MITTTTDTATGWTAWKRERGGSWRELLSRDTEDAALTAALDADAPGTLAVLPSGLRPEDALPPRRRRL